MGLLFFLNSILLGFGLAMDAFSVSLANGLNENSMKFPRMNLIAGTYAVFQFAMPVIGWVCVHTILHYFEVFGKFIPWIALILLLYIGIEMIAEVVRNKSEEVESVKKLSIAKLMMQGIATSIDALSVGFAISDYGWFEALIACVIIAAVTWITCLAGLEIGKRAGTKLAGKAGILGGVILIAIGIEIFVKGI